MTHELRAPLNAIINYTRFIGYDEFGPLSEDQRMFRSRVLYNSEHLLDLLNDLLDISKIEIGRLDLMRDQVQLWPLLQGVEATMSGLAEQKGLELALDAAPDLPLVWIDKRRVRQILINLLGNAVKFTEERRITLSARATDDGMVEIAVTDTGIGIDPEHQELIFEEFRRVEGREKVIAMRQDDLHLVIVEDNVDNRFIIQEMLRRDLGVRSVTAIGAGWQFFKHLREHRDQRIDLILLDIQLPGDDGYAILQRIRETPALKDTAVIAVTANVIRQDVERARAAGFSRSTAADSPSRSGAPWPARKCGRWCAGDMAGWTKIGIMIYT